MNVQASSQLISYKNVDFLCFYLYRQGSVINGNTEMTQPAQHSNSIPPAIADPKSNHNETNLSLIQHATPLNPKAVTINPISNGIISNAMTFPQLPKIPEIPSTVQPQNILTLGSIPNLPPFDLFGNKVGKSLSMSSTFNNNSNQIPSNLDVNNGQMPMPTTTNNVANNSSTYLNRISLQSNSDSASNKAVKRKIVEPMSSSESPSTSVEPPKKKTKLDIHSFQLKLQKQKESSQQSESDKKKNNNSRRTQRNNTKGALRKKCNAEFYGKHKIPNKSDLEQLKVPMLKGWFGEIKSDYWYYFSDVKKAKKDDMIKTLLKLRKNSTVYKSKQWVIDDSDVEEDSDSDSD